MGRRKSAANLRRIHMKTTGCEWRTAIYWPIIRKMNVSPTTQHPALAALEAPLPLASEETVRARFAAGGVGCTAQRLLVGQVLFAGDMHVSADRLISLVAATGGKVSKATVYNTLNLLAERGLVRALQLDGDHTVFDSNTAPHHHLYDEQTGELWDVAPSDLAFAKLPPVPAGSELAGVDVVLRVRRRTP